MTPAGKPAPAPQVRLLDLFQNVFRFPLQRGGQRGVAFLAMDASISSGLMRPARARIISLQ